MMSELFAQACLIAAAVVAVTLVPDAVSRLYRKLRARR